MSCSLPFGGITSLNDCDLPKLKVVHVTYGEVMLCKSRSSPRFHHFRFQRRTGAAHRLYALGGVGLLTHDGGLSLVSYRRRRHGFSDCFWLALFVLAAAHHPPSKWSRIPDLHAGPRVPRAAD